MIAVVDYRAGNITSVVKALKALGANVCVTSDPARVRSAERVVLPGVGHFAATDRLRATGMADGVRSIIERGTPFLGICVGLQWLFEGSTEAPDTRGLSLFPGRCERFAESGKVPHVGWNTLDARGNSRLLAGLDTGTFVYYTHSYRAPLVNETVGVTDYDGSFTGAVERGNVFGVQFHPEKSGDAGLQVLRNFLAVEAGC